MMKVLFELFQIILAIWFVSKILKWTVFRKKKGMRGRKSITSKVCLIISTRIHRKLDALLATKESLTPIKKQDSKSKVIPLAKRG